MAARIKKGTSRQNLALNLRAARSVFQLSQQDLGLRCGLKRSYIGAVERCEVNPGIDNLDKIAAGIGVRAHVLLLSSDLAYADIWAAYDATPAKSR